MQRERLAECFGRNSTMRTRRPVQLSHVETAENPRKGTRESRGLNLKTIGSDVILIREPWLEIDVGPSKSGDHRAVDFQTAR